MVTFLPSHLLILGCLYCCCCCCCSTVAFSSSTTLALQQRYNYTTKRFAPSSSGRRFTKTFSVLNIRGGGGGDDDNIADVDLNKEGGTMAVTPIVSALTSFGTLYASTLERRPILTKSITAGLIFGISDWSAQRIEQRGSSDTTKTNSNDVNWIRVLSAVLVGLLYFGPAAHAWYEMIFRLFPTTSLLSTLQKATLGQILFGPTFTCIFFASSLLQSRSFTFSNWFMKIRHDLWKTWAAGLGYWPLVDLVSYSVIPPMWIPLFVNFCSFIWTIYLSIVANKNIHRRRQEQQEQ